MDHLLPEGEGARDQFNSPVAAMMDEDRGGLRPEAQPRARTLNQLAVGKFRFRTKVGDSRKRFEIPLLIPHIGKDDPLYDESYNRYKRWASRQIQQKRIPEDEFVKNTLILKRDRAVFEILHDYKIKFSPVRRSRECVYTTDNPIIADYIRWRIGLGHFDLVEDLRPLMIVINGVEYPAQITDEAGQRELAKLVASGADIASLVVQE